METAQIKTYFRCLECLSPFMVKIETPTNGGYLVFSRYKKTPPGTICDCGNENPALFEFMGHVHGDYWKKTETVETCKCNELCAVARGPNCNCACDGANHGHGLETVERITAAGKVRAARITPAARRHADFVRLVRAEFEGGAFFGEFAEHVPAWRNYETRRFVPAFASSRIYALNSFFEDFINARTDKKRRELYQAAREIARRETETETETA